ncbi:MAG: acyltransferase family protein [Bacteroidales bacterium]|nr:acyltransferase family protein [Bacteroidales bacterium]
MKNNITDNSREVWIDWLRVAACFMVFVVHSTEPFYLGGDGSLILTETDAFWASFFDSFVRSCVPLFIIASSYLQFPTHYPTMEFFRRRAVRILVPFLLWTVVYAFRWGEPVENFRNLLLNFNYAAGHLWFVYMLLGVYLLMPLLSPWAEKVEKKELQVYLGICLFTTMIPLIRDWAAGGATTVIYGPSGLPRQALFPLWGEASWNAYGTFYYFSGFIGYLLLGLYFRKFVGELSWKKTLGIAIPCYIAGFAISFGGFLRRVYQTAEGTFPVGGLVEKAVWWETTWCNDTIGVVLMAIAWILVFKKIKAEGRFYKNVLLPVSKASYGIYLMHLLILVPICGAFRNWLGSGSEGVLGFWTTPAEILLSAITAFIGTSLVSVLIRRIPKIGKYIV